MPFRGGSFNSNQSQAGVFALYLNDPRSNTNHSIGFRSALFQSKTGIRLKVIPFRGGAWATSHWAGLFAFSIQYPRSTSAVEIGFRSALFQKKQGLD